MPFSSIQTSRYPHRPLIGITMGDPLGIGPEILVKALQDPEVHTQCIPLVLGDPGVMQTALSHFDIPLRLHRMDEPRQIADDPGYLNLLTVSALNLETPNPHSMTPGIGKAMADYIYTAVDLALSGKIDALVTAPITKTGLKMAGSPFHGHTELIAHQTGTQKFAMMLAGKTLKVVLVTIHMPLSRVPDTLTREKILETILLTSTDLKPGSMFQLPGWQLPASIPMPGKTVFLAARRNRSSVRRSRPPGTWA